jgi:hypothetical protein
MNRFSLADHAIGTSSESSLKAVKAFVSSPSESSALGSFYSKEARRIMEQRVDYAKLASQVLSLMSFAKRNLTMPEMQHALALSTIQRNKGRSMLNVDDKGVANAIISSCNGLLEIRPESQEVTLVNDSASVLVRSDASGYFKPHMSSHLKRQLSIQSFHSNKLQEICITCLAHSEFKSGPCRNERLLEERFTRYPFYKYACKYWAQHVLNLKEEHKKLLWEFLKNDQSVAAAYQGFLVTQEMPRGTEFNQATPQGITGMHLVPHLGLNEILLELIEERADDVVNQDSNGHTPLWWAAKSGMKETAKILIPKDYETVSSLVRLGDMNLVKLLLDAGYNLNRKGAWGRTLLHNAIMEDQPIIAHKLLVEDAKFDEADINGDTPLTLALRKRQHQTTDILLDMGASTKNTTLNQWRIAYGKLDCNTMQLTKTVRKTSLKFFKGGTQGDMEIAVQNQAMNLL